MAANPIVMILLVLVSTAAFVAILVFGAIQNIPNNGLFNSTISEISKKYPSDITPADYAFSIWGLIFLFQASWLGYAFSCMCRTNNDGLVLLNPVVLPIKFHLSWIISCIGTVLWYFFFDAEQMLITAVDLIALTVLGFVALFINVLVTARYEKRLSTHMYADLMCIRILIQNGLDLFFSWTTFASLIGISLALTYDPNVPHQYSQQDAGTFCLYALGVIIIGWSVLENTKLFRLFKYVYSWYFVLIWALTGIIVRYPDTTKKNTIITITLLCVSVVCLAAKITVFMLTPASTYTKAKKYKLLEEEC